MENIVVDIRISAQQCHRLLKILAICLLCGLPAAQAADGKTGEAVANSGICFECHEQVYHAMAANRHQGLVAGIDAACIRCHSDDIAHSETGPQDTIGYRPLAGAEKQKENDICLSCHKESQLSLWHGSGHESADLSCAACHSIHNKDLVIERKSEADVCFRCHQQVRGEILKPYSHPIKEEKLACSDCHQPHGGSGAADIKGFTVTETCTDCHPDKRGPFLWEHQPVSENCNLCHTPHGSSMPGMLTVRGPHLCQQCHQSGAELNARHGRLALGYSDPDNPGMGPGGGSAGISRFVLARNCMNCHTQVHGSNHPSGAMLER